MSTRDSSSRKPHIQAPINRSGRKPLAALRELHPSGLSTLDLETVLTTVVARAAQVAGADAAAICECDDRSTEFRPRACHNFEEELVGQLRGAPPRRTDPAVGPLAAAHASVHVTDLSVSPGTDPSGLRDALVRFGYRALLALPLLREEPETTRKRSNN